jgi:hypothetical protein
MDRHNSIALVIIFTQKLNKLLAFYFFFKGKCFLLKILLKLSVFFFLKHLFYDFKILIVFWHGSYNLPWMISGHFSIHRKAIFRFIVFYTMASY